jgi:hypothetical protein
MLVYIRNIIDVSLKVSVTICYYKIDIFPQMNIDLTQDVPLKKMLPLKYRMYTYVHLSNELAQVRAKQ